MISCAQPHGRWFRLRGCNKVPIPGFDSLSPMSHLRPLAYQAPMLLRGIAATYGDAAARSKKTSNGARSDSLPTQSYHEQSEPSSHRSVIP
jgi:hypothetical protein